MLLRIENHSAKQMFSSEKEAVDVSKCKRLGYAYLSEMWEFQFSVRKDFG